MNVALVNNHYQLGGAETVVRQLHFGVRRLGHASTLHVSEGKTYPQGVGVAPMYPRLLSRLDHSRWRSWVRRIAPRERWTDRAFRALARSDADVIHVHSFHGLYARTSSLAWLAQRKPVVWTFHRFWGITGGCDHPGDCRRYLESCGNCPRVQEWPLNGVDNTAAQLAEKKTLLAPAPLTIVSPSHHLARTVRESPVGRNWRVEVIPNGVDPAEFEAKPEDLRPLKAALGLPPQRPVVLAVNRSFTDPVKGGELLAEAIRRSVHLNATFVLAGGSADDLAQKIDRGDRVRSVGYVADRARLAQLLRAAEVFLYASPGENFPCATIEAMAAECCVVSTPTDGVLEQFGEGREGLFAPAYAAEALASTLRAALADPEALRERGRAARRRVIRDFSEAVMIDRHLALYADLMQRAA